MDHQVMFLVLTYLAEVGSAESGEVAENLGISSKHASMVLLRCFRRGFVWRRPYKRGRVRGYVYELTDKGAEWVLYKSDQWKKVDENERKPTIEVGKESIHQPSSKILNLKQNQQGSNDFMSMEVRLPLWLVSEFLRKYQSLKQKYFSLKESHDLAFIAFFSVCDDRDLCFYEYLMEREKREPLEKQPRQMAPKPTPRLEPSQMKQRKDSFALLRGRLQGLGTVLRLGIEIGRTIEITYASNVLFQAFLKKKFEKLPIAQARRSDADLQKPEAQTGKEIIGNTQTRSKSFPFAIPTPSAQTLKIMAAPVKGLCKRTSIPKKAVVAENGSQEDDWKDFNSWWRNF